MLEGGGGALVGHYQCGLLCHALVHMQTPHKVSKTLQVMTQNWKRVKQVLFVPLSNHWIELVAELTLSCLLQLDTSPLSPAQVQLC